MGAQGISEDCKPAALLTEHPAALRVLAVEDDDIYRTMLATELAEQGFLVTTYPDGQTLLQSPEAAADADVILLDWGLPQLSGIELLTQLRRLGVTLPVVFLTGRPLTTNEAMAFDRGAMDFVDKSRGVSVLVHRLRLAASAKGPDPVRERSYLCGKLLLKPHVSRAYWNDVDVDLTVAEFRVVHRLALNVGQYVTYREIYDCVRFRGFISGTGVNGYRANVRSAIKRIRKKFLVIDPGFSEIQNYTAFGYVWGEDSTSSVAA